MKKISMKCSPKEWESIKHKLSGLPNLDKDFDLDKYPYLTNNYKTFSGETFGSKSKGMLLLEEEVHEKFNAEIFLEACGLNPSVGESNFVAGCWYKKPGTSLVMCLTDVKKQYGYGVGLIGLWLESTWGLQGLEPASDQEVEEALTSEAKRRGYKNGNYKCLSVSYNTQVVENENLFRLSGSQLWHGFPQPGNSNCVFKNGKWAEILEVNTTLELIEEARRRGYGVKGCKIEKMDKFNYGFSDFTAVDSVINNEDSQLFFNDNKGYNVLFYRDGEWATIVKEPVSFQITQKQILDIHEATSNSNQEQLETWFPDAFTPAIVKTPTLEKGKWYKKGEKFMFCFNGTFGFYTQHGFNHAGEWRDRLGIEKNIEYTAAEEGEVSEKLSAEAKKRGYKKGNFKCVKGWKDKSFGEFYFYGNILFSAPLGQGGRVLFDNGRWAKLKK